MRKFRSESYVVTVKIRYFNEKFVKSVVLIVLDMVKVNLPSGVKRIVPIFIVENYFRDDRLVDISFKYCVTVSQRGSV